MTAHLIATVASVLVIVSTIGAWIVREIHRMEQWLQDFVDSRIVKSSEILSLSKSIETMSHSITVLAAQVEALELVRIRHHPDEPG